MSVIMKRLRQARMDFKIVLETLTSEFARYGISYALIGGMAFNLWGVHRSTVDVDFLVLRDDMEKVAAIMEGNGYECRFRTENVSQFVSPLRVFGEVDFLHAFRDAAVTMLKRPTVKAAFNGQLNINVLGPEDLIGLKLQAMKNDPQRVPVDASDIRTLVSICKNSLDVESIKKYFEIFEMDFHDFFKE
ncbi:MAG: nucleotidyltransferase [Nitrospirae bacterium]|nr:nucleotidyltransferase [Nitrospirota bacterium]